MKTKIIRWIKIILIIYIALGVALYFLQDYFLFHPQVLPADYHFTFNTGFEEIKMPCSNNSTCNIIRFKRDSNTVKKGAVIYCHGNMENVTHYAGFAPNFTKHGYDVWMMDYPGFGKSTGELNEATLYSETLQVYNLVSEAGYSADSIIIYGKSLGTGIAAQLAGITECKRLILESPYYSIANLADHFAWMYPVDLLLHYKIPTNEYLQKVKAPVTIFHGTDDGTIPFSNAEKLKANAFKTGDELIAVEGGSHNDLNSFAVMKKSLDSLLEK